ncbi:MAG TPA: Uma2 family endonuclease [Verrucomicrobiota bacterium]|nr:hypothetical protein [Verrucomicrobiales bacterium]HRI13420.1 Uma2 family endonuclease [Verrucomicrobiota bacterium]
MQDTIRIMSAAEKYQVVSEAEYLASEDVSVERHEWVGGVIYSMAGETTDHNQIAQNLQSVIRGHLRGSACRVFINGVKLRLDVAETFYYPDIMVACDPRDTDRRFIRYPRVIIEVLSEHTQQTDRREKLFAYLQVETLEEYVLVSSLRREIVIYRRADGWHPQPLLDAAHELQLASLDLRVSVSEIYEGAVLGPASGSPTQPG